MRTAGDCTKQSEHKNAYNSGVDWKQKQMVVSMWHLYNLTINVICSWYSLVYLDIVCATVYLKVTAEIFNIICAGGRGMAIEPKK